MLTPTPPAPCTVTSQADTMPPPPPSPGAKAPQPSIPPVLIKFAGLEGMDFQDMRDTVLGL